jgi:non-heme chloroperoxidase
VLADRSQFYKDLSERSTARTGRAPRFPKVLRDQFWAQSMTVGLRGAYDCIKAFSETDLTMDLQAIDVPTLIIHGDDDQIVPIVASAQKSVKLVKDAELKVYPGAPHGLTSTMKDEFHIDLLAFLRA